MKRRQLDLLLGALPLAWPLAAPAQQPSALPVIGFLSSASPDTFGHLAAAFRDGLRDVGLIEGSHFVIEYRWAEDRAERLPQLAADLVQRRVAVLAATGGTALAAKAATSTLATVFTFNGDPVARGMVADLARPGGNRTGMVLFNVLLEGKRLALLHEAVPSAGSIAFLDDPRSPRVSVQNVEEAARRAGVRVVLLEARSEADFEPVFASLVQQRVKALTVGNSPLFNSRRDRLVALAARHKVPAIYEFREFALAGGLMSYGTSLSDVYRQLGVYAARILQGAKPADLPVLQPTRFELVINLRTARALGITIPPSVLLRADEVIE